MTFRRRGAVRIVAAALAFASTACTGSSDDPVRGAATTAPAGAPATDREAPREVTTVDPIPRLQLRTVGRFEQPLALTFGPDGRGLVAEKGGRVRELDGGDTVVDLSDEVSTGFEQGLLGVAADAAAIYVNYTDRAGDTRVVRYDADGTDPRELLRVDQPFANHNGGHLVFGPDGMLYVSLGDGGSGGDPQGNGQKLSTRLGKILRLDPRPSASSPYSVPPDNPFVGRAGADPLIWAYGLRNPWRFSFDRVTGDVWIADVGQGEREEVSLVQAGRSGANLGWDRFEGTQRFEGDPPADHVLPVHDYDHDAGACSVTGGFRSRDRRLPGLYGAYLFGDFCDGRLRLLRREGQGWRADELGIRVPQLASFGEGPDGELYVLSLDGAVSRIEAA